MFCIRHSYEKQDEFISEKGFNEVLSDTGNTIIELYEKIFSYSKCSKCGKIKKVQLMEKIINCSPEQYLQIEDVDKEFTNRYRTLILPKKQYKKKNDEAEN